MKSRAGEAQPVALDTLQLVALDVDGVLTDGKLDYGPDGETHKTFHVHDGMGVRLLLERGLAVAVITARSSEALARRCAELGIARVYQGCSDKLQTLREVCTALDIDIARAAYVGDDIVDAPALRAAGVGIAPADGHAVARAAADWVTRAPGGGGAVREIADAIAAARPGFIVVIPARHAATRLPGKPLRQLAGKPLVQHVWDRATESGASEVLVAVDDERVRAAVAGFGGRAVMTAQDHPSGTDRLAEVVARQALADDAIVVNVQGDEPGLPGELIRQTARALAADPGAGIATIATPIEETGELFDPNVVKVVMDRRQRALAFSRAPIPWVRDAFAAADARARPLPPGVPFYRHIGIYAYRAEALRRVTAAPPCPLERAESLEQLRALHLGIAIRVDIARGPVGHGIDTEADLERAEALLQAAGKGTGNNGAFRRGSEAERSEPDATGNNGASP